MIPKNIGITTGINAEKAWVPPSVGLSDAAGIVRVLMLKRPFLTIMRLFYRSSAMKVARIGR